MFARIQFPNKIFFLKTQKTILKNCSQKLFFRTVLKNSNQTGPQYLLFLWHYSLLMEILSPCNNA